MITVGLVIKSPGYVLAHTTCEGFPSVVFFRQAFLQKKKYFLDLQKIHLKKNNRFGYPTQRMLSSSDS
jgi:hypothetical protein